MNEPTAKETVVLKRRPWLTIRDAPSQAESWAYGGAAVLTVIVLWWLLTRGETPIVDAYTLPSLSVTFGSFGQLWFERELSISALTSLGRVLAGFTVTAAIGVPLGVIAGSYLRLNAFLKPLSLFGRNVPIAALIPLTLIWFGIDEVQKVMFIFLATVAFVLFDSTNAVQAVPDRFLDTGYTLGVHHTPKKGAIMSGWMALIYGFVALSGWYFLLPENADVAARIASVGFWLKILGAAALGFLLWFPILSHQALRKVLLPLALPDIANSLRLIFGVAFGYIMLAEVINAKHGLGSLIIMSQRQGPREHVYLCLFIISLLAWGIDRLILMAQKQMFPHLKHG
jgi:NitT/TauT family transport system permease protein